MTVNVLRGISTVTFLRLCSRAPRTISASAIALSVPSAGDRGQRCPFGRIGDVLLPNFRSAHSLALPMFNEPLVVLTTLASADEARAFVRALVDARLVACGTL